MNDEPELGPDLIFQIAEFCRRRATQLVVGVLVVIVAFTTFEERRRLGL